MKICTKCLKQKSLDAFKKESRRKEGKGSWCKECHNEANKIYQKKSKRWKSEDTKNKFKLYRKTEQGKRVVKRCRLKIKFNMSIERFEWILKSQLYGCAICKLDISKNPKDAHVDHCHITGKVRGLLCHYCNIGLGHFKDSISNLKVAIEYLNKDNDWRDLI